MSNKTYVLDTSVCLTESSCLYRFENNDIVIPLKVLEEIDNHKKRQDAVGATARRIIKIFDSLREEGNLQEGVLLGDNRGTLRVAPADLDLLPDDLDRSIADHVIISTALSEHIYNPDSEVVMVSRDINMRVICDSLKVKSADYNSDKVIKDHSNLYEGYSTIIVDDDLIDMFYDGEDLFIESMEMEIEEQYYPNQMLMLVSSTREKKAALCRYQGPKKPLRHLYSIDKKGLWGVKSRNKEQAFAFDLLMDPKVPFVSLVGKAGSGKTLLAIAAGISQVINDPFQGNTDSPYKKLVISRPVMPMGKDIGFLPGTLEEKMHPWLMPIQDNLQYIMGSDKLTIEEYTEKGIIEIEALTYIRGRSISNAFIIIDEAQNLSMHEIKTIMTRVGEGTKIVLTGDVEQIDNIYVDETSTGLVHAVEKFKSSELSGHITLKKGERSAIATLAAKIL
jgi:PhoH-like ATPase